LAFFQLASSRGADRRLANAGLGPVRVAAARVAASLGLGVTVSAVAFATLWARSGINHPVHAAIAIFSFAAIYIGVGALVGAVVSAPLEGSLLVVVVFSVDAFSGPQMTSSGGIGSFTPTKDAASLLIAAGGGQGSPAADWAGVSAVAVAAIALGMLAFWFVARTRS
jgi:hypothetical protein